MRLCYAAHPRSTPHAAHGDTKTIQQKSGAFVADRKPQQYTLLAEQPLLDHARKQPNTRSTRIFDNYAFQSAGEFLRGHIQKDADLAIVTAYFTIYAYQKLQKQLDDVKKVRLLFGEPRFIQTVDPEKSDSKAFIIEQNDLRLQNILQQKYVARQCAEWIKNKVEVRSIQKANFLHGKMYHISNPQGNPQDTSQDTSQDTPQNTHVLTGSSNFTVRGLGLQKDTENTNEQNNGNNIELNLSVEDADDQRDLLRWFDTIWGMPECKDVKEKVLGYLENVYVDVAPEEIYYQILFYLFQDYLDQNNTLDSVENIPKFANSDVWQKLFDFQRDGVRGAIAKIRQYNGCILSDSVGLGKTFEALAVIKYFELRGDRVLVLCPKKLRENWTMYQVTNPTSQNILLKDRLGYTVLSHTDLGRESGKVGDIELSQVQWDMFDLIVIDESHNFRNASGGRYEALIKAIREGRKTKLLLLSATPVNNNLSDLLNQILLITENDDRAFQESLGIDSLRDLLKKSQRSFVDWTKKSDTARNVKTLVESLGPQFFRLLDGLTIARSRKHIVRSYAESMQKIGAFPKRNPVVSITPPLDVNPKQNKDSIVFTYDHVYEILSSYQVERFNFFKYVYPEKKSKYETHDKLTPEQRAKGLSGMLRTGFLKRLESSVHSFCETVRRAIKETQGVIDNIVDYQESLRENLPNNFVQLRFLTHVFDVDNDGISDENDILEADNPERLGENKRLVAYKCAAEDINLSGYKDALEKDNATLQLLLDHLAPLIGERDAKLQELKEIIAKKQHKTNKKILVFTAFADTAEYLYQELTKIRNPAIHFGLVTGDATRNRSTLGNAQTERQFQTILMNFSPISKGRNSNNANTNGPEIDILIATDCISEGQNLQDCDMVVNYDIHWNPVRIIQRFGRIDRIGSRNHEIHMINFWPTEDFDKYINLKMRVEARMALADLTATAEDNLLNRDELTDMIERDLRYRNEQLRKLKTEVIDLEDIPEGQAADASVSISSFTLDGFRADLLSYLTTNKDKLKNAPKGRYAVVSSGAKANAGQHIKKGAIFCLKNKLVERQQESEEQQKTQKSVNPLHPYVVFYVQEDQTVVYHMAHPQQALDTLRALCFGQKKPIDALCETFNHDTEHGQNVKKYADILQAGIRECSKAWNKNAAKNLTTRGGFKIPKISERATQPDDFSLIAWVAVV